MKKFLTFLLIFAILLIAAAGGGIYAAHKISVSDTNFPKLSIDGIDVSKLTKEQTVALLRQQGWDEKVQTPLTVTTLGGQTFQVEPLKAQLAIPAEEAAELAYAYGRDGNLIDTFLAYGQSLLRGGHISSAVHDPDLDYIRSCVDEGLAQLDTFMGEEEYTVDVENSQLVLKKGWGQLQFDKEDLVNTIVTALRAGQKQLSYDKLSGTLTCPDFQAIHTELKKEPKDASYTDDGKFDVIDEVVGCEFDVAAAESTWNAAQPAEEVTIPLSITWPAVTGEQLRNQLFHDMLGACTTKYPNSNDARRSNLRLATSKLDGVILYPGDVLSYNETVGARTEEAGFQMAPAYVNGEVKDELGGGACQVSSTLYCATVFAFLETVERENHYFPVNYMQLGTDATVTIPDGGRVVDFKFKNNKNYPIKIVGYCNNDESTITFEIWGTLEDEDYMPVEFDNTFSWNFDYDRVIEPAYPDRPGYKIKLTHELYNFSDEIGSGYRTLTWRHVYDSNGELVTEEIINMKLPNGNPAMDTYYKHE